jgi:hypothetical protein
MLVHRQPLRQEQLHGRCVDRPVREQEILPGLGHQPGARGRRPGAMPYVIEHGALAARRREKFDQARHRPGVTRGAEIQSDKAAEAELYRLRLFSSTRVRPECARESRQAEHIGCASDQFDSPVASCGAPTGFDSGEPRCLR